MNKIIFIISFIFLYGCESFPTLIFENKTKKTIVFILNKNSKNIDYQDIEFVRPFNNYYWRNPQLMIDQSNKLHFYIMDSIIYTNLRDKDSLQVKLFERYDIDVDSLRKDGNDWYFTYNK